MRRAQVLMGKWLGLVVLAVVHVAIVGSAEIVAATSGTGYRVRFSRADL